VGRTSNFFETDMGRWPRHLESCICFACHRRRERLEREALFQRRVLVLADEPREHVLELVAEGMSKSEIAR
jgi:hypothetical protein